MIVPGALIYVFRYFSDGRYMICHISTPGPIKSFLFQVCSNSYHKPCRGTSLGSQLAISENRWFPLSCVYRTSEPQSLTQTLELPETLDVAPLTSLFYTFFTVVALQRRWGEWPNEKWHRRWSSLTSHHHASCNRDWRSPSTSKIFWSKIGQRYMASYLHIWKQCPHTFTWHAWWPIMQWCPMFKLRAADSW